MKYSVTVVFGVLAFLVAGLAGCTSNGAKADVGNPPRLEQSPSQSVTYMGRFFTAQAFIDGTVVKNTLFIFRDESTGPAGRDSFFGFYGNDLSPKYSQVPFTKWRGVKGIPGQVVGVKVQNPERELKVQILKSPQLLCDE